MGYGVAMRTKSYCHLSTDERETLSLGLAAGHSLRTMARVLGRAPSTVSRESARNRPRGHPYRACTAQVQAAARPVSHGVHANFWTRGCGSTCGRSWPQAARPNRLPDVFNARILTICGNTYRPRPFMRACMSCPVAPYGANSWRHCVRRARRADLGRGGLIGGAQSPT